jgi:hypothetical protein
MCTTGQHDWSPNGNYQETSTMELVSLSVIQLHAIQTKCEQSSSYVGADSMIIGTLHVAGETWK